MKRKFTIASLALAAALTLPASAFAQHHGGGGGHGGGGHVSAQAYGGGGYHGSVGVHPSYNPGYYHGNYNHAAYYHGGYHGGYHYYGHPYYYHGHYYPYYPYYGGLAFGLYVSSLPFYYSTYWWGGVPYYYSDGTYYTYDDHVNKYEVVPPPGGVDGEAPQAAAAELFAYPKNGQTEDQQRTDRFECHQWAVNQTGFDPTNIDPNKGASAPDKPADYRRAETACLNGRGYSVR